MSITNSGHIIGNLTSDVILNNSPKGPWAKIRIAWDDTFTEKTEFFEIFFSGRNAENLSQYGEKGRLILVEYRLGCGSINKGDVIIKTVDLYGTNFKFLSSSKEKSNE